MRKQTLLFVLLFFPWMALAQVLETPPTGAEWEAFFNSLGGLGGAGTLAIIAAAVQGVMLLLRSPLGALTGKFKLVILALLTAASGVTALLVGGADWGSALMHSSTLIAYQVLFHQIYKQFIEKKQ